MDQFTKNQTRSRVEKHKPEPEIPFQAKKRGTFTRRYVCGWIKGFK